MSFANDQTEIEFSARSGSAIPSLRGKPALLLKSLLTQNQSAQHGATALDDLIASFGPKFLAAACHL
jgi:hypothetical protein